MKKLIAVILAALFLLAACGPDQRPDFEQMPQDRARWANPAGYGLPPETEEYNGLVF